MVAAVVEWDETGRVDTGLLGLTTKHLYFAGSSVSVCDMIALSPSSRMKTVLAL